MKPSNRRVDSLLLAIEYTYNAGRARVLHAAREDTEHNHYRVRKLDFF